MSEQTTGGDPGRRVGRRSVLAALGAAAGGSVLPSASADAAPSGTPAVELGPLELPAWEQLERHEAATTPNSDNQASNVRGRRITSVKRSVSQVNLKLWEADDVGRPTCGDAVGQQHRFIATTMVYGTQKRSLSYYYDRYQHADGDNLGGIRNPPAEPIRTTDEMESHVRIPDGAPNEDACGTTTFRVNNVFRKRLPLSSLSDGSSLYGDSGPDHVREQVSEFQQRRTVHSPYVPDDSGGLVGVATSVLGTVADPDLGSTVGLSEQLLDAVSGAHPKLKQAKGLAGKFGTVGAWAGVAGDSLALLSAMDDLDDYNGKLAWADDGVYVAANEGSAHELEIQFVDFTVTVPPGEQDPEGTTVEITQDVGVDDDLLDTPSNFGGQRPEDGGYLHTDHTWELEIPAYSADDFEGIDEERLPTLRAVTDDGDRAEFGDTPPDPSIEIQRSGTTDADPITFEVADYEDDGDTTYRWRIYKNGGVVRPATLFGSSVTLEETALDRSPDPTVGAFGPGQYVAELTIRDRFGQTTTTARNFTVDPAETAGTTAVVADQVVTATPDETVELSAAGSVGHDGTADSVDLIEWDVQYPTAITGGVVEPSATTPERREAGVAPPPIKPPGGDPTRATVEHTFDHVGVYRAAVRVWSLEGSYTPSVTKDRYYDKPLDGRRLPHADKRDVTVVVVPEDDGTDPDSGRGVGTGGDFGPITVSRRGVRR